jgi:hypothetical protein
VNSLNQLINQMDPVVLHGFMTLASVMHKHVVNWNDTTAIDFHRFHALKQTNERLSQECSGESNVVSDSVIMAVSMLVNTEVRIEDTLCISSCLTGPMQVMLRAWAPAEAHMKGLRKMVEMRGGLTNGFTHNIHLFHTILW